ncbi:hypothetical protein HYH08_00850 [Bradyrhizobium sp. BR 10289]|nr:hypothetical protein [Bradyrhizobium sp. BR 10289]
MRPTLSCPSKFNARPSWSSVTGRSRLRRVSFESAGVGTSQHLAGKLFQQMTGIRIVHFPTRA